MTDSGGSASQPPSNAGALPSADGPPAGAGPSPAVYGQVPGYHGSVVPTYSAGGYGPLGEVRPTGKSIALFVCTLGLYGYVYNFRVHSEMKRHSGRGIGGGIALLLTFIAGVAMPFVTPAEVGSLYARRGESEPVRGWTGLWFLGPAVGGYIVLIVTFITTGVAFSRHVAVVNPNGVAPYRPAMGIAFGLALGLAFTVYVALAIAGGIVWFLKTNRALNRYWESIAG